MLIFRIIGLAITTAILVLVIRQKKPELAFLLSLTAGLIILVLVIYQVAEIISLFQQLAARSRVDVVYLNTILRIMGIAYLGEFGAEVVRDADQQALAEKIELAVKVIIMFTALPIIVSLVETIIGFLP